jgi:hypothetical protein
MSKTLTQPNVVPESEGADSSQHRTFTAEYKAKVLAEWDTTAENGRNIGVILRREGLYSSHLNDWATFFGWGPRSPPPSCTCLE